MKLQDSKDGFSISFFILCQILIYQTAVFSLWLFNIFLMPFLETKVVTWALFFVIDDWAIIADYFQVLKGRIMASHLFRLVLFNTLFSIVLPIAFMRHINWWSALILFAFLAALSTASWSKLIIDFRANQQSS